jgi:predicted acetyltransferase
MTTCPRAEPTGFSFEPALPSDCALLDNLAQYYAYDFSEVLAMHVGADGRFADVDLTSYWVDAWRHPFLIRVDGNIAGFALISERSKISGEAGTCDMAEFFVLRRFRRQGVGRAAAFAAFGKFNGPWEVRQREENPEATAFWRRTIREYTGGAYDEQRWTRPDWAEIVQRFAKPAAGPNRI